MTKIQWDTAGERVYEAGLDRGVLYPINGPGVSWNGLISVSETPSGGTATPYYLDGFKYLNEPSLEEFEATINAFTYPDEFSVIDGSASSGQGLTYTQQPREVFGLSYRTKIGNDLAGQDHGYKIHLLYNVLASPTQSSRNSLSGSPEAASFSWAVTSSPKRISARKPTSHLVIDSLNSDPEILQTFESILYGSVDAEPRLPSPEEVITLFDDWARLELQLNSSTGLNKLIYRGLSDLKGDTYAGIYAIPADSRLTETAVIGLYSLDI